MPASRALAELVPVRHGRSEASTAWHPWQVRALLIVGCLLAIAFAAQYAHPSATLRADPALARLLRGMALIKSAMVAAAVSAVWWRSGWRLRQRTLWSYLVGAWVLAGATMLIWQLAWIVFAAVLFHAAAIGMLMVGWRDK